MYALPAAILLLGNCWYAYAYVALPAAAAAAAGAGASDAGATDTKTYAKHMAELMTGTYPDRAAASSAGYLNDVAGSIAVLPPHQLLNEPNGRAAVYDPGDGKLKQNRIEENK